MIQSNPTQQSTIGSEDAFKPIPVDVLPKPVERYVLEASSAIGCDPSYITLPLLTACASVIGNTRRLKIKNGWWAPSIIWTIIIGESGNAKSPAFRLALAAIHQLNQDALESNQGAMEAYQVEIAKYEKDFSRWKSSRDLDPPPNKPVPPSAKRFRSNDATIESLFPILLANPKGILLDRDELAGWFNSFDKYSGGGPCPDTSHWLSMYNAESVVIDRKTGEPKTILVPEASLSITGGCQPGILKRLLNRDHRESGLAARFLMCLPPRKQKFWTEDEIDDNLQLLISQLFARLATLERQVDEFNCDSQRDLTLTPEAKKIWTEYYNDHNAEQMRLSGDLAAAWSKFEEYAARLALVFQLVHWAGNEPDSHSPHYVDELSMRAGVELTNWFKAETRRIYDLFAETDSERELRKLIQWIRDRGHPVTAREVFQGIKRYQTSTAAEEALNKLMKMGKGSWQNSPPGQRGQPTRRFALFS